MLVETMICLKNEKKKQPSIRVSLQEHFSLATCPMPAGACFPGKLVADTIHGLL